jgi:tetratricopeptide (TPR) repeat protein
MVLILFGGVLFLGLVGPKLLATAVSNLALVEMGHGWPCTKYWSECRPGLSDNGSAWQGEAAVRWRPRLARLREWLPGSAVLALRAAEAGFAAGDVAGSAALLPPVAIGQPPRPEIDGGFIPPTRSRLLTGGRYENYLLAAYQKLAAGEAVGAIESFRWAFSLAPEYINEADFRAYSGLMSDQYAQGEGAGDLLLAGQYALWAGLPERAEQLLSGLVAGAGGEGLTAVEAARARSYLGQALAGEKRDEAGAAYQAAMGLAPDVAEPRLRLLALTGDPAGLDRAGPGYRLPVPVEVNGRRLIGYDVEEAAVEAGGPLDGWLWWQGEGGEAGMMAAGAYWIEPVRLLNLAPNPGFEWGAAADGLPLGYIAIYYTNNTDGVSLVRQEGPAGSSMVLSLANNGILGLRSYPFPVDPEGVYLTMAWTAGGRRLALGRKCFFGDHPDDRLNNFWGVPQVPHVLVERLPDNGDMGWSPLADVSRTLPEGNAVLCQLVLEQQGGQALFDRVLLARLPL